MLSNPPTLVHIWCSQGLAQSQATDPYLAPETIGAAFPWVVNQPLNDYALVRYTWQWQIKYSM